MKTNLAGKQTAANEFRKMAAAFVALGVRETSLRPDAGITRDASGGLRVSYQFRPDEIKILETLSSVTGVSLDWFASDALSWTTVYITGLTDPSTGLLNDLIGAVSYCGCPVLTSHRMASAEFVAAVKKEAGNRITL